MDITIPPHNLKRFSASITCLGKIGKDLYLSFDEMSGLTLSSLNDAKSAYGKFHFDSQFFERCSAPPTTTNKGGDGDEDNNEDEFDTRYVCRVPVRSVHSILRPRKGVCSLRIRSEGMDDKGNYFGLNQKKKKKKNRNHSRSRDDDHQDDDQDDDNEDEDRGRRRRGSMSARERSRSRSKRRKQSKMKRNNHENEDGNNDDSISKNTDKMMLSFEFFIERPTPKSNGDMNPNNNAMMNGGIFRVLHKVGVTDANGITLSASIAERRTRSEIVSHPRLWLRLLDPLRRTAEVALTIDDELKVVTATSFHPGEIQQQGSGVGVGGEQNAVLQAAAARNAVLKTETSTGAEEFDEYDFRSNRGKKKQSKKKRGDDNAAVSDESGNESDQNGEEEEEDYEKESEKPPMDVNEKVILVFSIKEAKAMLQYCAQNNSASYDDDDEGVILSFHWGGRPIVIETDGDYFSGELVLATLHHGMIASNITVGS